MGQPQPKKHLYSDEDYDVRYEVFDGLVFIHLEVYNWSASVYKKGLVKWNAILRALKASGIDDIHCTSEIGDHKHLKFIKMYGFEHLLDADNCIISYRSTDPWE